LQKPLKGSHAQITAWLIISISIWIAFLRSQDLLEENPVSPYGEWFSEEAAMWFDYIEKKNEMLYVSSIIQDEIKNFDMENGTNLVGPYFEKCGDFYVVDKLKVIEPTVNERGLARSNNRVYKIGYDDCLQGAMIKNNNLIGVSADKHWVKLSRFENFIFYFVTEIHNFSF